MAGRPLSDVLNRLAGAYWILACNIRNALAKNCGGIFFVHIRLADREVI